MATKQELLDEAAEAGVEVDDSMTKAQIQEALDAAATDEAVAAEEPADEPEADEATVDADASAEELRGPLDGVEDADDQAEYVDLGVVQESVEVDASAEPEHSPEVARGPLEATPAESVRHYNPGSGA